MAVTALCSWQTCKITRLAACLMGLQLASWGYIAREYQASRGLSNLSVRSISVPELVTIFSCPDSFASVNIRPVGFSIVCHQVSSNRGQSHKPWSHKTYEDNLTSRCVMSRGEVYLRFRGILPLFFESGASEQPAISSPRRMWRLWARSADIIVLSPSRTRMTPLHCDRVDREQPADGPQTVWCIRRAGDWGEGSWKGSRYTPATVSALEKCRTVRCRVARAHGTAGAIGATLGKRDRRWKQRNTSRAQLSTVCSVSYDTPTRSVVTGNRRWLL